MKSSVFSRCLNVLIVAADVTEAGRLFHIRAAGFIGFSDFLFEREAGNSVE